MRGAVSTMQQNVEDIGREVDRILVALGKVLAAGATALARRPGSAAEAGGRGGGPVSALFAPDRNAPPTREELVHKPKPSPQEQILRRAVEHVEEVSATVVQAESILTPSVINPQ